MKTNKNDIVFCTLALGKKYHLLAQNMARNLMQVSLGNKFVILTDDPESFVDYENVVPVSFRQRGILHCYHDRRFAIAKALEIGRTAISIDVDANFTDSIPTCDWKPGIESRTEDLISHVSKYTP